MGGGRAACGNPREGKDGAAARSIGTLAERAQARYRAAQRRFTGRFPRAACTAKTLYPNAFASRTRALSMNLALYEPDIPQNTGTILRLCACLGLAAHIIEPAGFPVTDRAFRRAGMDYLDAVDIARHASFAAFEAWRQEHGLRLVLLTTAATQSYLDFQYAHSDVLLLGRESAGVPETVHTAADARVRIPLRAGLRSLNVALAAAMVSGEALRQVGALK